MNRIFQHYEGEVPELEGLQTQKLRILIDQEPVIENIILLWIETEKSWLRIFIDGTHCAIDEFEADESDDDLEEDTYLKLKIQDDWVQDLSIKTAKVSSNDLPLITLTIDFTNNTQLILSCDEDENCKLIHRNL